VNPPAQQGTWQDLYASPPEAKVERHGRWWFRVYVSHGLMQWGPGGYGWLVFGERRAYAKARRVLRKYNDREARPADVRTVTL
jgi:hypothetical protein